MFATGETIPIRLFLAGYELTPTMVDICKRFSVRYYLNIVLIDEDDRCVGHALISYTALNGHGTVEVRQVCIILWW